MLPMNLTESEVNQRKGFLDRQRVGASLADVDPMELDQSITFHSVGGHPDAIKQLQEMVVLPLLYPTVFSRFHVSPPRGVLFYGPPGTGKTLMARALVNECSQDQVSKVKNMVQIGPEMVHFRPNLNKSCFSFSSPV